MTQIDELVKRARSLCDGPDDLPAHILSGELRSLANALEAQAALVKELEAQLNEVNEKLNVLSSSSDRGSSPIYKVIERVLDEHSAWITRPNSDVTRAIALASGIAWMNSIPEQLKDAMVSIDMLVSESDANIARIATLEAQIEAFREAAKPIDKWLKHLAANGSRRLKDDEYPAIFGCPDMGKLRALMSALRNAEGEKDVE